MSRLAEILVFCAEYAELQHPLTTADIMPLVLEVKSCFCHDMERHNRHIKSLSNSSLSSIVDSKLILKILYFRLLNAAPSRIMRTSKVWCHKFIIF